MEILKRIINLIYALLMMLAIFIAFSANWERVDLDDISNYFLGIGGTCLVFSVINFALFKKLTFWNKWVWYNLSLKDHKHLLSVTGDNVIQLHG